MARITFTPKKLESLVKRDKWPPKNKRFDYWDSLVPAMGFQVTEKGHASYNLLARYPDKPKNPARRVLGIYGAITLETARDKARSWLQLIGKGIDPRRLQPVRRPRNAGKL